MIRIVGQIVLTLIGLTLGTVSLFLVTICFIAAISSLYDPVDTSRSWIWALPGLFLALCCAWWSARLVFGRRRHDGRLLSRRIVQLFVLMLDAVPPFLLVTGKYRELGLSHGVIVLSCIISFFLLLRLIAKANADQRIEPPDEAEP